MPKYDRPDPIADLVELGKDDDHAQNLVVREGTKFVYVADRVRCIHPTRRLQHADAKSASVGPDLRVGEEFDVMWMSTANDGNEYYLTPWSTRILAKDVERVNDTPAFAEAE